jgi:hypothetical protein
MKNSFMSLRELFAASDKRASERHEHSFARWKRPPAGIPAAPL